MIRVKNEIHRVCRALLKADADIRDIIQFGSSVYAADCARDIDLLVTTLRKKDYEVYLDAASGCGLPADVIVRQPGEPIGEMWLGWWMTWRRRWLRDVCLRDWRLLTTP
jgi:hypothetical protein